MCWETGGPLAKLGDMPLSKLGDIIDAGQRVIDARRKGTDAAHGPLEKRQARNAEMQRLVDELRRDKPELTCHAVCVSVAKKLGVHRRTVRRNTTW